MANLDVESALNDIAWLFKRFRGLEQLVPFLEDIKRLDEAIALKKETVTNLNVESQDLRDEIKREATELANLKKTKTVRQSELDSEASSFRKRVNEDLADYKDRVMQEIDEQAIAKRRDLADLESRKKQIQKAIQESEDTLRQAQKKVQDFQSRLDSLKAI